MTKTFLGQQQEVLMKKVSKILLAAVLFLCFGSFAFAHDGLASENAVGVYILGADEPVGGIQYGHRFNDLVGIKIGSNAYYNNRDSWNLEPMNYNVTLETDFTLFETNWRDKVGSRLFAYVLAGHEGRLEKDSYESDKTHFSADAIVSAGFGFDFIFFDHLSVPFQFGYLATFPSKPNVGFCAGIGLRYCW